MSGVCDPAPGPTSGRNTFNVRATGGVRFVTRVDAAGNAISGCYMDGPNNKGWTCSNSISGSSTDSNGVQGTSSVNGVSGVYGENSANGYGVAGRISGTSTGIAAIYGDATASGGQAGLFNGPVQVNGSEVVTGSVSAHNYITTSDRNAKRDFAPVELSALLKKVATPAHLHVELQV